LDPRRAELSQHFLRSKALASSLVSQARVTNEDVVVEIGPGRGILTAELASRCRKVIGVEVDARLYHELRRRFSDQTHVSVVQADFLRYPLPERIAYKVVGNIPFSLTAAIMQRLVTASTPPSDAFVVVQREAAERFAGSPFAPESRVSLLLKPWWQVEIARRLRRTDFDPPPRVDSVLLWLARRTRPLIPAPGAEAYRAFIDACFGRTATTVGQCLRVCFTHRQIQRLSRDLRFEPADPPSSLSFDQWLGLFRFRTLEVERG
jgi:23S rRNA (adenine-N6)-dimethyltransferase